MNLGSLEIVEREWWHHLIGWTFRALTYAGLWWLWVFAFKLQDVPAWSFYLAALVGGNAPMPEFFIRRKRA